MSAGYKDFIAGATLAAADLEDYCELQAVMRFTSTSARDTALASVLTNGLMAYTTDTSTYWYYTGSAWVPFGRRMLQMVNVSDAAVATGTTVLPYDDTIPQNTEGDQYMSLAVTPLSASSYLLVEVVANVSNSVAAAHELTAALFVDTTAGALAAVGVTVTTSGHRQLLSFDYYVASASTTARTYKLRLGCASAGTTTFNGQLGTRSYGGVSASSITITEIAP